MHLFLYFYNEFMLFLKDNLFYAVVMGITHTCLVLAYYDFVELIFILKKRPTDSIYSLHLVVVMLVAIMNDKACQA